MRPVNPVRHIIERIGFCRVCMDHMIRNKSLSDIIAVACAVGQVQQMLQSPVQGLPEDARSKARHIAVDLRQTMVNMDIADVSNGFEGLAAVMQRAHRKLGRLGCALVDHVEEVAA